MNRPTTTKRRRNNHKPIRPPAAAEKSKRILRIFLTDADATDSSSSEEDHSARCRRAKTLIREIGIGGHPRRKFRGVRQRPWGRFSAEIRNPVRGKRVWLGTFDTAEEAAEAYNLAASRIKEEKAITNFPMERAAVALPSPVSVLRYEEEELLGEWGGGGYGDVDVFGFSVVESPVCLFESIVKKPAIWEEIDEFEELDEFLALEANGLPSFA